MYTPVHGMRRVFGRRLPWDMLDSGPSVSQRMVAWPGRSIVLDDLCYDSLFHGSRGKWWYVVIHLPP